MACNPAVQIASHRFALVASLVGAIMGAASTARASPPDPSSGCGAPQRLVSRDYTEADWPIRQDGTNGQNVGRTFNVHVPKAHEELKGAPLPIVINLHGSGGTATEQDRGSRMRELGDLKGFVVATPDAWPWSQWTVTEELPETRYGISDIAFIRMLLDTLVDKLCIDRNRIYATGASNGGVMSATLGGLGADGKFGEHKLAAVAPVASMPIPSGFAPSKLSAEGADQSFSAFVALSARRLEKIRNSASLPEGVRTRSEPVPIHVFYGSEDRVVANGACYAMYLPWVYKLVDDPKELMEYRSYVCSCYLPDPGKTCAPRPGPPSIQGHVNNLVVIAQLAVNVWAFQNGCKFNFRPPDLSGRPGWGVPIVQMTFDCTAVPNARGDTILTIYDTTDESAHPNSLERPDGHIWPGGVDPPHQSTFKVTDAIWDFFEKHPR